jgi:hypothetical protein
MIMMFMRKVMMRYTGKEGGIVAVAELKIFEFYIVTLSL